MTDLTPEQLDDRCKESAWANGKRRPCHLPAGHDGSHIYDGGNFVIGWEGNTQ